MQIKNTSFQKTWSALLLALAITVSTSGMAWSEHQETHDPSSLSIEEHMQHLPKPNPKHAWLQQFFVGEWNTTVKSTMNPEQPPMISKGTETIRPIGGFWILSENKSTFMENPFTGSMVLGYSADKNKYVGTWVDSMTGHMWEYEGNVDASGKVLTLETEGPCPLKPGEMVKFKEVIEVKDKDTRRFTSFRMDENGQWVNHVTIDYARKN